MTRLWVVIWPLLFACSSAASVIDFNSSSIPTGNNIALTALSTQGVTFTSNRFSGIGRTDVCVFGGCVGEPKYLAVVFGDLPIPPLPLTMTEAGGGPFALHAFDADGLFLDAAAALASGFGNATGILVMGTIAGGASLSQTFTLNGGPAFQTFTMADTWTNLVSVSFSGLGSGANRNFAIDNINVTILPEPATGTLLITSSALLLAVFRLRSANNRRHVATPGEASVRLPRLF